MWLQLSRALAISPLFVHVDVGLGLVVKDKHFEYASWGERQTHACSVFIQYVHVHVSQNDIVLILLR